MTDRHRIIIARQRGHLFRRWRWAIEEELFSGEWRLRHDASAFTRANALAEAFTYIPRYQVDRLEAQIVVRYERVPERPAKASPLPPELLDERAEA